MCNFLFAFVLYTIYFDICISAISTPRLQASENFKFVRKIFLYKHRAKKIDKKRFFPCKSNSCLICIAYQLAFVKLSEVPIWVLFSLCEHIFESFKLEMLHIFFYKHPLSLNPIFFYKYRQCYYAGFYIWFPRLYALKIVHFRQCL